ncbi:phage tail tube protein [Paenibacillus cymbidii]|uniref:phage tail tube protein n=1 Tax=Paenibacillus cymbidii TaxID=1639034 RepID=UPI0010816B69|nr:cadherin-like beta sandwich domain-containing protein [Paenibacillus cymbidii]
MPERSVGTKLKIGLSYVAGLTSIDPPELTQDTTETTTLDNAGRRKTFIGTWLDDGEIGGSGYFESGDAGQSALLAARNSGEAVPFEIIYPPSVGASWIGEAIVTSYKAGSAELEELLGFEFTLKVSGEAEFTTTASAGLSGLSLTGTGGTLAPTFSNSKTYYTYDSVSATNVTVTATAADHEIKLYIDGVFSQDLTTAVASASIPLTISVAKKLTIIAKESGKTPVIYEVVVLKTS